MLSFRRPPTTGPKAATSKNLREVSNALSLVVYVDSTAFGTESSVSEHLGVNKYLTQILALKNVASFHF